LPPTRGALFCWTLDAFCFGTAFACKQEKQQVMVTNGFQLKHLHIVHHTHISKSFSTVK
jgi:hypothetical protein